MSKRTSILISIGCFIALLILFYFELQDPEAASEFVDRLLHKETEASEEAGEPSLSYTMIGDEKCVERPSIETYLIIGTDRAGELADVIDKEKEDAIRSDTLILLVVDKAENTFASIPINRNTIMAVDGMNQAGEVVSTSEIQASFAYAGGYTREQSCENASRAISRFLYDAHIDHYIAFSISAIRVLNHAVGGVEVEITDDFSRADPSLVTGQKIRLTDDQAETFVRGRMEVDDGTNENRMSRQEVYLAAWSETFYKVCKKDEKVAGRLYDDLGSFMYTNMLKGDASRLAKAYVKNDNLGVFEIDGKVGQGDFGWATFDADEASKAAVAQTLLFEPLDEVL